MAEKKIQARIRQKVDTKANWDKATNFVPLKGEYIYYSDLHKVKVGDGTTKVGALPFLADSDTHFTTGLYVGTANTKANGATTNGNTYLKAYDDNTRRAQFLIHGSGATSVSSDANGNITISSTDSHFTTGLYVGKVDEKSNSATTNGNTYLKLFDNDTKRAQHLINGGGATMVTSNASGSIEIATPIKKLDTTSGSGLGKGTSENIAGSGTIYLHKVAKTGSYNDLVDKPTIPTNLVTIDTEQRISGKKYFENDVNLGKWVNPVRQVSDAPAKLNLISSAQTTAGFFDTVMFAGAGDWLYLGHLKPDFSIRASFRGTGDENDTYSANLEYTHGTLNTLTDWDYQGGWCVRPTKVSTTTPAIIQIKFTRQLYTDVLRLIITGHNLNDTSSGSAYSGFLDDYTIEVCTNYTNDTWTTVVNRTNANDSIGAGLMYSLQTASYTSCYGIRLKITKCHVNGNGYAFIKITSMQLRDYRPGIKFPDCLGAISQGGGDVWGELYTKSNLVTHNVLPYKTNESYIGNANSQYWSVYSHDFYENGTALSDKYLAKGSASTNNNQVVYNPVELKKGLIGNGSFTLTNTEKGKPLDIRFVATTDQSGVDTMGFNATDTLATLTGSAYMGNTKFTLQSGYSNGAGPSIVIDNNGYKTTITADGINVGDRGMTSWPTSGGGFVTKGDFANENATDPSANQGKIPTLEYPGTIPLKFIKPMVSMYASESDLPGAVHFSPFYVPDALYVTKDTNSIYRYNQDTESYIKLGPDTSKFLDKGSASSEDVEQYVYNTVGMKNPLYAPSFRGEADTIENKGVRHFSLDHTTAHGDARSILSLTGHPSGTTSLTQVCTTNIVQSGNSFYIDCNQGDSSSPTFGFDWDGTGWNIDGNAILTEVDVRSEQWKLISTSGAVRTVNVCVK